ncbi:MAG: hypothetical protein ACK5YO_17245, partial [Planctomyces sp.]
MAPSCPNVPPDPLPMNATDQLRSVTPLQRGLFLLLLLPSLGSALTTLIPDAAPPLQVVTERPALVFETYLADS